MGLVAATIRYILGAPIPGFSPVNHPPGGSPELSWLGRFLILAAWVFVVTMLFPSVIESGKLPSEFVSCLIVLPELKGAWNVKGLMFLRFEFR